MILRHLFGCDSAFTFRVVFFFFGRYSLRLNVNFYLFYFMLFMVLLLFLLCQRTLCNVIAIQMKFMALCNKLILLYVWRWHVTTGHWVTGCGWCSSLVSPLGWWFSESWIKSSFLGNKVRKSYSNWKNCI